MATQSRKTGFPDFFGVGQSAETLRRRFIEAPLEAAGQSALGAAFELATLMGILPDAFAVSQQRELKRILRSANEDDPRVVALRTSIEQADVLQTTVRRGQARVQRVLVALAGSDDVFHGFVSDAELAPLKGLTVRLTGNKVTRGKVLSATTDDDGYFSITLGTKNDNVPDSGAKASPINLSQRIMDLFIDSSQKPDTPPAASAEAGASQVEIVKKGALLYSDPVPVALDEGSIYREYVIADTEPSSASDLQNFMSDRSSKVPGRSADPSKDAADAWQPDPNGPPSPAAAPRATKKSARGAKSIKPGTKK